VEGLYSGEFQLPRCSELLISQKEVYFGVAVCKPCSVSHVQNIREACWSPSHLTGLLVCETPTQSCLQEKQKWLTLYKLNCFPAFWQSHAMLIYCPWKLLSWSLWRNMLQIKWEQLESELEMEHFCCANRDFH